jgi:hypothetical protein
MTYLRTIPLALLVLAACTPDPGDESSSSNSSTSTSSSASSGDPGTGEPTTTAATSSSDSEPATTGTTSDTSTTTDASTTSTTDDTTTGALACGELPDFVASFTAWETARDANANTYYYSLLRGPSGLVPPDFCIYRTLVAVADGEVIERRFEIAEMVGEPECDKAFTEQGDEVGTGTADYLAPAVTVDALYSACCDMVLHIEPADEYTVTFSTDKEGLMKTCYYVANGCADGCDGGPLGAALDFEALAFGAPPPAP